MTVYWVCNILYCLKKNMISTKILNIILIWFLGLGSILLGGILLAEDAMTKDAEQQMVDFNFAGYEEGGTKKWDVSAEVADFFTEVVNMQNVIGRAYGKEDNMQLVADEGVYNKVAGTLHLQDNVIGTSDSGARLVTDSLNWDAQKSLITTEDKVDIKKENMQTIGTGVVAHQDLKTVTLKRDVTVNIDREEKGIFRKTVITCDGSLDIDYNAEVAVFNDNVVATDEQGKMFADKMTVYFDTKTKKIRKVICTGDVKIENQDNSAYGEVVTYDANGQKARLTGRPCLIFYTQKEEGQDAAPFGN